MIRYEFLAAAALGLALTACGGQQQAERAGVDSNGPAGYAGPPPGAAPEPGVGDANTVATPPAPIATSADASRAGEGGETPVDPTSGLGDRSQDSLQQTGPAADGLAPDQRQPVSPPTQ